jgi:hypothetical protein
MRFGYRSLKYPNPKSPDFWQRSETWWDDWAHNFGLSLLYTAVLLVVGVIAVVLTEVLK